MSKRELRRVGVLARVASEELKLVDVAKDPESELPAGEADLAAIRKGRCGGIEAPQRREKVESSKAEKVSSASSEITAEEILRGRGRKIRADTGQ